MLLIVSPAKTLDFDSPVPEHTATRPEFVKSAGELVDGLRALPVDAIGAMMSISPGLAALNHARFQAWRARPPARSTRAALLAFRGDVYLGMRAGTFTAEDFEFAQQHLRILSGLYGLLRPLDAIQPYRLEMGTALVNARGRNLYDFWGPRIADALERQLRAIGARELVNLASQEYFRAVAFERLSVPVISPVFKERRGGALKIVSFSAKRARGAMTGFAIRHRLQRAEELKAFSEDGYRYEPVLSSDTQWLFVR